jgi:hypothetical protein
MTLSQSDAPVRPRGNTAKRLLRFFDSAHYSRLSPGQARWLLGMPPYPTYAAAITELVEGGWVRWDRRMNKYVRTAR